MASEIKISGILKDIQSLPAKRVNGGQDRKDQKQKVDKAISELSLAALEKHGIEIDSGFGFVTKSKKKENQFVGAIGVLKEIRSQVASTQDKKVLRLYKQLQDRVYRLAKPLAEEEPNKGVLEQNNNATTEKRKEAKAGLIFGFLEKARPKDLAGDGFVGGGNRKEYREIFEVRDFEELQPFREILEKKREVCANPEIDYATKICLKKEILIIQGNILQKEMLLIKPNLKALGFNEGGVLNIVGKSFHELAALEAELDAYEEKFLLLVDKTARQRAGYQKFEQEHKGYITDLQEAPVKRKIDAARNALEREKVSQAMFDTAGFGVAAAGNAGVVTFNLDTKTHEEVQNLKLRLAEFEKVHAEQKEKKLLASPKQSLLTVQEKGEIRARINGAKKAIKDREAEIKILGDNFGTKIDAITSAPVANRAGPKAAALQDLQILRGSKGFEEAVVVRWTSAIEALCTNNPLAAAGAGNRLRTPEEVLRQEEDKRVRGQRWTITNTSIDVADAVLPPVVGGLLPSTVRAAIVPALMLAAAYWSYLYIVPMLF